MLLVYIATLVSVIIIQKSLVNLVGINGEDPDTIESRNFRSKTNAGRYPNHNLRQEKRFRYKISDILRSGQVRTRQDFERIFSVPQRNEYKPHDGYPVSSYPNPQPAMRLPATANILPATANMLPVTARVLPAPAMVLPDASAGTYQMQFSHLYGGKIKTPCPLDCPPGWVEVIDACYKYVGIRDFSDAEALCQIEHPSAHLPVFRNAQDLTIFKENVEPMLQYTNLYVFLAGCNRRLPDSSWILPDFSSRESRELQKNGWKQHFNSAALSTCEAKFLDWNMGEPNNAGGNETCVVLLPEVLKYNDVPCDVARQSLVCQIESFDICERSNCYVIDEPEQSQGVCKITKQCVPINVSMQHNQVSFPKCIILDRCFGHCCDKHESCTPRTTNRVSVKVTKYPYLMEVDVHGIPKLGPPNTVYHEMEEHVDCGCNLN